MNGYVDLCSKWSYNLMDYDHLTLLSILFDKYELLNSNSMK
jgi:hypothetical protein